MYLGNVGQPDSNIRSKTAADWVAGNYPLLRGELGIESDTGLQKVGVGSRWDDTPYHAAEAPNITVTPAGTLGWSSASVSPLRFTGGYGSHYFPGKWIQNFSLTPSSGITAVNLGDTVGVWSPLTSTSGVFSVPVTAPSLRAFFSHGATFHTSSASYGLTTPMSFPSLEFFTGSFCAVTASLTASSINLPALRFWIGSEASAVFPGVSSINLSSIEYIGGSAIFGGSASSCSVLTLPPVGTWKSITGNTINIGFALNQASVDSLLAHLAYMDGNNGTLAYGSGKTLTITGSNSAPSNLGSTTTPGSNFVCSGTTCTVNWTGHGYQTGDVLRISGILTATLANRYALITVVNDNQFTYTITSQTATGAGTATVVKAGPSAAALVTRGVTLTTN